MNYPLVFKQLATVAQMLGGCMLVCLLWALPSLGGVWKYEAPGVTGIVLSAVVCFGVGFAFKYLGREPVTSSEKRPPSTELFRRETILLVALCWIMSGILGALPYLLSDVQRAPDVKMSVIDALFESQSGFSTTGSSVLSELEDPEMLPRCVLFWRCMTNFIGGLGVVVLFVAILGQGMVGKNMFRTDMAGLQSAMPQTQVRQTALFLVKVYLGLTVILFGYLVCEGVTVYDAICHAFTTISTGGFSTFNASVGHFAANTNLNAARIEWTFIVFMMLGGTRFLLFYWILCQWKPRKLFGNTEFRTYIGIFVVVSFIVWLTGHLCRDFDQYGMAKTSNRNIATTADTASWQMTVPLPAGTSSNETVSSETVLNETVSNETELDGTQVEEIHLVRHSVPLSVEIRFAVFQMASLMTTTGYSTDDFVYWNPISRLCILFVMLFTACAGSTTGGIKIVRLVLCFKILWQEIERYFRPNLVRGLWLDGEPVTEESRHRVVIFVVFYLFLAVLGTVSVTTAELFFGSNDYTTATVHSLTDSVHNSLTALGNVGPASSVMQTFGEFTSWSKCTFIILMLLGRQELFVIVSLCTFGFWRKI